MKKTIVDEAVGKKVKITLYDGTVKKGVLIKGSNFEAGYYSVEPHHWFRSSHIKKMVVEQNV